MTQSRSLIVIQPGGALTVEEVNELSGFGAVKVAGFFVFFFLEEFRGDGDAASSEISCGAKLLLPFIIDLKPALMSDGNAMPIGLFWAGC